MSNVTVYTKPTCPYCHRAKDLLDSLDVPYTEYDVSRDPQLYATIKQRSGMNTVPQVFAGDTCLGGFSEISALHAKGMLLAALGLTEQP